MSFTKNIEQKTIVFIVISLLGGVIGGFLSDNLRADEFSDSLSGYIVSKDTEITTLNNKITELEEEISLLEENLLESINMPVKGFNTPDFDSGWIDLGQGSHIIVNHGLETSDLFV